jgi:hypothetical protein
MQFLLLLLSESLYVMQVDVMHIKKPLVLFQWMGMNALIVYVLAACELFPTLIQGFYWRSPENNLVRVFCISIICHICCRLCIELTSHNKLSRTQSIMLFTRFIGLANYFAKAVTPD